MNSILPNYEVKELPSRFIGYPEGVRIFVQPYTAGQAMNIEMVGKSNMDSLEEVLDGVIIEGMNKGDLSPQDILFLGVYRNLVSSKSDKITINSICPKCLAENKESKSLGVIKFKELEGFDKDCYPIEVDFDNYTMKFEFLTYNAFKYCMKKYRGAKTYQIAFQVLEYKDKSSNETYHRPYFDYKNERHSTAAFDAYISNVRNIIFDLVDEDKDALNEVISILEDYGTKPIEVTCQDERCKHQYTVNIDEEGVLVTPFRESGTAARTRVKLRKSDIDKSASIQTIEPERSRTTSGNSNEAEKQLVTKASEKKTTKKVKPTEQIQYFNQENQS